MKKEIRKIVGKYLDLRKYKVFFFGSRISGRGGKRADIDIGIEGPRPVPIEILSQIEEEMSEIPTLYHIDIVDFKKADKDFQKVAKQNMEIIK